MPKQKFTHLIRGTQLTCYIVPTASARHQVPRHHYAVRTSEGEEVHVHENDLLRPCTPEDEPKHGECHTCAENRPSLDCEMLGPDHDCSVNVLTEPLGECPKGKRPCGHHCNHSWTHDSCCWCGAELGEEDSDG